MKVEGSCVYKLLKKGWKIRYKAPDSYGGAFQLMDMRSEERFPCLRTLKYICIPYAEEDFKGVAIDISKAGMSLYIFSPCFICGGLRVRDRDDLPPGFNDRSCSMSAAG